MQSKSEVLVEVTRGPIPESRHHGSLAVVDKTGKLIASAGDPYAITYMRSAAKPLQALEVVLSGAADRYAFTDQELAIMCGSHYGETFHRATIFGILNKIGFSLSELTCGSPYSIRGAVRDQQLRDGIVPDQANSDCSGKHCGFLAVCKTMKWPTAQYADPEHPLQKEIYKLLSEMCGIAQADIVLGTDGCGVPVHAMPLYHMALGYARLANPETLPEARRRACNRIFAAMNAAPQMVGGTGSFCSEFIRHTHGRLIGKLGAEAVYCVGIRGGISMAVRIEDGTVDRALYPVVLEALMQLDAISQQEARSLWKFYHPDILNHAGKVVGHSAACFTLTRRR